MTTQFLSLTYADGLALRQRLEFVLTKTYEQAVAWRAHDASGSPRYEPAAINAELAMILYRLAVRLGLHATGTEAGLLAHIDRLEARLATLGAEFARGQAAAQALTETMR